MAGGAGVGIVNRISRRAVLATVGSATVAGCGWSQEQQRSGPQDGAPQQGDSSNGDENGQGEELATSEGGGTLIEKESDALLLRREDLDWDGWQQTDHQGAGTCNAFEGSGDEFEARLEACAAVYESESAAVEEYEGELDRAEKLLSGKVDVDPEIGDDAALYREGSRDGTLGEEGLRLLFRDANGTGRIQYTLSQDGFGEEEVTSGPEGGVSGVVEWGALMHDRWRD